MRRISFAFYFSNNPSESNNNVHTCFSSRTENRHGIFPIRHRRGMTWCSDILGTKSILWLCNKFSQTKHMNSNPKCGIWGRTKRISASNGTCYEQCEKPWSMQPKGIKGMSLLCTAQNQEPSLLSDPQGDLSDSVVLAAFDHRPVVLSSVVLSNCTNVKWQSKPLDTHRSCTLSPRLYWPL